MYINIIQHMYKSLAFKARGEFRINIKTFKENQQIIIKETNQTLTLLEHCTYQSLTWQSGDLSSGMQSSNFSLARSLTLPAKVLLSISSKVEVQY